ncbi:MAG TPA: flavin reductase family protein [Stellaceae bacterium]|nr:flavin reductase family protein [Stellaceae bacterium]
MFYEPDKNNHGLRFNPFKSICVPRPIAWVSSLSAGGVPNLAPFSQFTNVSYDPPHVLFCPRADTDTARNIAETGEFVVNMATFAMREAVNATSAVVPPEIDEAALCGVTMVPSRLVRPQRVETAPTQLECRLHSVMLVPARLAGHGQAVIIGRVVGVHIRDDVLTPEGRIDIARIRPLARLGYLDYTSVESVLTMPPPDGPNAERSRRGLEGRPDMAVAAAAK